MLNSVPQQEIFIRGMASLLLVNREAHKVLTVYLNGSKPKEIAKILGMPPRNVYRHWHFGREFLLSFIEGETLPFRVDYKFPKV